MMNQRITSIDALRGLVMFTMIFVNDLASAGAIVPDWMMHYELRHGDANGMTFVDLLFPAFLFIVGMSIPFALGSRMDKGERTWKTLLHVLQRTASLLFIGVLMVNEAPDGARLGWSPSLWVVLMFVSAISAFGSIKWMRLIGFLALLWLAYIWVGLQVKDADVFTLPSTCAVVGHPGSHRLGLPGRLHRVPCLQRPPHRASRKHGDTAGSVCRRSCWCPRSTAG